MTFPDTPSSPSNITAAAVSNVTTRMSSGSHKRYPSLLLVIRSRIQMREIKTTLTHLRSLYSNHRMWTTMNLW